MGKKAREDEVNFNYPIPRSIHQQVRQLNLDTGMPVKDIVINALIMYLSNVNKKEEMGDDL